MNPLPSEPEGCPDAPLQTGIGPARAPSAAGGFRGGLAAPCDAVPALEAVVFQEAVQGADAENRAVGRERPL